ncbi:hypothetical protein J7643_13580 [bacterium]|nr:hypothetical protein [bacterium]
MSIKRVVPPVALALLLALAPRPAVALPINFANAKIPAPGHGLFMVHPTLSATGASQTLWGNLELGVADRLSLSLDGLALAMPQASDFGTSYLGLSYSAGRLLPWLNLRLTPLYGFKVGRFGERQAALRAYLDLYPTSRFTIYTMAAYHHRFDAAAPGAARFDVAGEYRLMDGLNADLEVLSGTPSWDFGPNCRLAIAPGLTASIDRYTLKASLRIPVVKAETAQALEAPFVALGLGTRW